MKKSTFLHLRISFSFFLLPVFLFASAIADFMVRHLKLNPKEEKNLRILYRASGIQKRYSVLEDFGKNLNGQSFFKEDAEFPTSKLRMDIYQKNALKLACEASLKAIKDSKYIYGFKPNFRIFMGVIFCIFYDACIGINSQKG